MVHLLCHAFELNKALCYTLLWSVGDLHHLSESLKQCQPQPPLHTPHQVEEDTVRSAVTPFGILYPVTFSSTIGKGFPALVLVAQGQIVTKQMLPGKMEQVAVKVQQSF